MSPHLDVRPTTDRRPDNYDHVEINTPPTTGPTQGTDGEKQEDL